MGSGRPETRAGLCLGLVGIPLGEHITTHLAWPDQARWLSHLARHVTTRPTNLNDVKLIFISIFIGKS
jgi:hypothetical protein